MSVAAWGAAVSAVTIVNVVLVRMAYVWEKNRSMTLRTTLLVAVLLVLAYAVIAVAIETG